MKISAKIKTRAKISEVKKTGEYAYEIRVNVPPVDGKANEAVIKSLSDYFKIQKSRIKILAGISSKNKIIEIG